MTQTIVTMILTVMMQTMMIDKQPEPAIYDIPLTATQQQAVSDWCQDYDLAPELALAVMAVESSYDPQVVNGSCRGVMQLHNNTWPGLAKALEIADFDPLDFDDCARAGILKLAWERDYWLQEGYSDEDAFAAMLLSYNRGRAGAERYIEQYGLQAEYVDKVLAVKCQLERSGRSAIVN